MRSHADEYAPFVETEDGDASCFESYCDEVESTAAWGGQLELRALAHVLRRPIAVFAAGTPPLTMGEEYARRARGGEAGGGGGAEGGGGSDAKLLRVAFLQHAYGLGEHYNSVMPAGA